jgi:O-antigen/teichoic acid export membrane protein
LAGFCLTAGSFVSTLIIARLLGVEKAGVIAYAVWLVAFIIPIFDLGLSSTVARYVPALVGSGSEPEAKRLAVILFRVLLFSLAIAAVVLLVIGTRPEISRWIWSGFHSGEVHSATQAGDRPLLLWALLAAWVSMQGIGTFAYAYLRGVHKFGLTALLAVLGFTLQVVAVSVGALKYGVEGAIFGYVLGQIPAAAASLRLVFGSGHVPEDLRIRVLRYIRYAWAGNVAIAFVWSRIEVFFLERSWGSEAIGIFSAALALSTLAVQGPMLLTTGLLPHLSQQAGRKDTASLQQTFATGTRIMAFLVFPCCLGAAAIMPALLPFLYGASFAPASMPAIILLAASAISAPSVVATNLVYAVERSDFIFQSGLIGATLSILAGLLLVPALGPVGAAGSRAFVQIAMVILAGWFVTTRLDCKIPFRSLARLLAAALLSSGIAAIAIAIVPGTKGILIAVPSAAVVYFLAVWLLNALPREDIERLMALGRSLTRQAS